MPPSDPQSNPAFEPRAAIAYGAAIILFATLAFVVLPRSSDQPHASGEQAAHPVTPAPVLEPTEALAAFKLADGVRIDLAASEPMIVAPVAAAFDENGRLWVAEMRTY